MKYLAYDKETGEFAGFYDSEVHTEIPENTIQIAENHYTELFRKLNNPEFPFILKVVDKNITMVPIEEDLPLIKEKKIKAIKELAKYTLSDTDWIILRHLEEKESGEDPTLTPQELHKVLKKREKIRKKSNDYENEIKIEEDPKKIKEKDIFFHDTKDEEE